MFRFKERGSSGRRTLLRWNLNLGREVAVAFSVLKMAVPVDGISGGLDCRCRRVPVCPNDNSTGDIPLLTSCRGELKWEPITLGCICQLVCNDRGPNHLQSDYFCSITRNSQYHANYCEERMNSANANHTPSRKRQAVEVHDSLSPNNPPWKEARNIMHRSRRKHV